MVSRRQRLIIEPYLFWEIFSNCDSFGNYYWNNAYFLKIIPEAISQFAAWSGKKRNKRKEIEDNNDRSQTDMQQDEVVVDDTVELLM